MHKYFLLSFLFFQSFANAQMIKGDILNGNFDDDLFGTFIQMPNANTIGVLAPCTNNISPTLAAYIKIFKWKNNNWVLKGSMVHPLVHNIKTFKMPDANTIAIQGSLETRIFEFNGTDWVQKGADLMGSPIEGGMAMCDANHITILKYGTYINTKRFKWDGLQWLDQGINGTVFYHSLIADVEMPDSNTVGIGLKEIDDNRGLISIQKYNGNVYLSNFQLFGTYPNEEIGTDIKMPNSTTLAYSSSTFSAGPLNDGYVKVISYSNGNWVQKGQIIFDNIPQYAFGYSIDMIGNDILAVACEGNQSGIYIYKWDGALWQKATFYEYPEDHSYYGNICMPDTNNLGVCFFEDDQLYNNSGIAYAMWVNAPLFQNNNLLKNLSIFPNPSHGEYFIELDKKYANILIEIYDMQGQIVFKQEYQNMKSTTLFTNFATGTYLLEIKADDKYLSKKIQKW